MAGQLDDLLHPRVSAQLPLRDPSNHLTPIRKANARSAFRGGRRCRREA